MKNAKDMKEIAEARIAEQRAFHLAEIATFCEKFSDRIEESANQGQFCYAIGRDLIPQGMTSEEVANFFRWFGYTANIERYAITVRW